MPGKNQNAACQVAHAISTHSVEREFDFYTAVDDLKPEDTAGADMMGTVEFNSACFYRYAVVDWEKQIHPTAVTTRDYLADAVFLVGLEGADRFLMEQIHAALRDPVWPLALGRKSYVPSESIWIENGLQVAPFRDVLARWPWIATLRRGEELPERLLVSFESADGSGALNVDQPLASFAERRFGSRFVRSEWIPFPQEVPHVPA